MGFGYEKKYLIYICLLPGQMWMINGSSFINKADNWKSEPQTEWNLINNGTTVYINGGRNIKKFVDAHEENSFESLGTFDSFNVIRDGYLKNFTDAQKSWKQGIVDEEGFFKLTHLTSQKVLTAIFPNKLILVDKGNYVHCIY